MDLKTKGAWLLSQSKNLDSVTGVGAARLENISYAGRIGRLYNLLRRNIPNDPNPTIDKATIDEACKLNGLDRATRETGLQVLEDGNRIDVANNGSITVLGATSRVVLEVTAQIFTDLHPSVDEEAVLDLSERVADTPIAREEAAEYISDLHGISGKTTTSLIDLCKGNAIIDEETDRDRTILFNSNTFRDGQYATKALRVIEGPTQQEAHRLSEVQDKLSQQGALLDVDVQEMLGTKLYNRLLSVGLFDRIEVSNDVEAVGYITSPNDFQKYGRPYEDDPIDDAKALIASLTYGQTRSDYLRGQITMPEALLRALINGREIGKGGVRAIGEDYRELEARQVVEVIPKSSGRYTMRLLKKDVGELALTIVRGGTAAQEAVLMEGSPVTSFKGPHLSRTELRTRNDPGDKRFLTEALDRLRTGG